jgi:hypothetical protein
MVQTVNDAFRDMIADKIKDIRKAIEETEKEIAERKDIDNKVQDEIQAELVRVKNRILEVEQFSGADHGDTPFPKVDSLEREMINLEGQKRNEEVSCWRDLTMLRKEIRIYMRELDDILRKAKMVQHD